MKIEIKTNIGELNHKKFIEFNQPFREGYTRHYYEFVDNQILKNMPNDILKDLYNKTSKELKEREGFYEWAKTPVRQIFRSF